MELNRKDRAVELHKKGYNCAQAVACNYCDLFGMDEETVFRILKMKFELGLFENPYADEEAHKAVIRCDKHKAISLRAAEEAIVLLTNNGVLPLGENYKKIAIIGPSSASQKIGGYSSSPRGYVVHSVYDELKDRYPEAEIHQCDGCAITHSNGETVHYVEGLRDFIPNDDLSSSTAHILNFGSIHS